MLPEHRKFLPALHLKTMKAFNVLEGGGGGPFQIDQNYAKLAAVAVVVPAPARCVLLAKEPQKRDRNSTELKRFTKLFLAS